MNGTQPTALRRGAVVLLSVLVLGIAGAGGDVQRSSTSARVGSAPWAMNDDDLWPSLQLHLPYLRYLLTIYEVRSIGNLASSTTMSASISDFIADYAQGGLRPDVTSADATQGRQHIADTIALLNAHPGVLESSLETQFRATLADMDVKLAAIAN